MTSIFQKLRVLGLGSVHDILDKAIDMNSPTVLRQYVRDLETAEAQLKNEAAVAAGGKRTLTRELEDLNHRITDKLAAIKIIQAGTNPAAESIARNYASVVVNLQNEVKDKQAQLAAQEELSANLESALSKIDAKHAEMLSQVHRLESLDRATKAKEQAAGALDNAVNLASSGVGVNIDSVRAKVEARADVADEKFKRAMNNDGLSEDPIHSQAVDELLAKLKAS